MDTSDNNAQADRLELALIRLNDAAGRLVQGERLGDVQRERNSLSIEIQTLRQENAELIAALKAQETRQSQLQAVSGQVSCRLDDVISDIKSVLDD